MKDGKKTVVMLNVSVEDEWKGDAKRKIDEHFQESIL